MSELERLLGLQLRCLGVPLWESEYRFVAVNVGAGSGIRARIAASGMKDWRFDFAWPSKMVAVEVEGITPGGGRHQRIGGFNDDLAKYHHAVRLGWTVYRTGSKLIRSGEAAALIERLLSD